MFADTCASGPYQYSCQPRSHTAGYVVRYHWPAVVDMCIVPSWLLPAVAYKSAVIPGLQGVCYHFNYYEPKLYTYPEVLVSGTLIQLDSTAYSYRQIC